MRLGYLFTALIAIGASAGSLLLRATGAQLTAELELARTARQEQMQLEAERDRLRAAQPSADYLAELQRLAAARESLARELETRTPKAKPVALPVGEWTPCAAWQCRGQATPRATVETALWAAAGGDLATLESLLELDDAAQTKAAQWLAELSPAARAAFPSPEALVASCTLKKIPLGDAQVVWLYEADRDHAAVGVMLQPPPRSSPAAPSGSSQPKVGLATLTLRRTESGWRMVVPGPAIDRMAREFAATQPN